MSDGMAQASPRWWGTAGLVLRAAVITAILLPVSWTSLRGSGIGAGWTWGLRVTVVALHLTLLPAPPPPLPSAP